MHINSRCMFVTAAIVAAIVVAAAVTGPAFGADAEAGQAKFKQFCTTCHGDVGKGDGPAARGLNPRPRDFSDAEWQASVDDEHIHVVTRDGGPAVGLSPMMTPWGHSLSEEDLDNIVAYIRSLDD